MFSCVIFGEGVTGLITGNKCAWARSADYRTKTLYCLIYN